MHTFLAPQINCFLTCPDFAKFEFRNVPDHVENVQGVRKSSDLVKIEVQKSPRFENTKTHATMRFQAHLSIFGSVPEVSQISVPPLRKDFWSQRNPRPPEESEKLDHISNRIVFHPHTFFSVQVIFGFSDSSGVRGFLAFPKRFLRRG